MARRALGEMMSGPGVQGVPEADTLVHQGSLTGRGFGLRLGVRVRGRVRVRVRHSSGLGEMDPIIPRKGALVGETV